MNRARRWYTVGMLHYDMSSGLAIFDFKLEGWEQIAFSLAKLIAFYVDNSWLTNGFRRSSANHI